MDRKVFITGGTGFIGRALVARAILDGLHVRVGARRPVADWPSGFEYAPWVELAPESDWSAALEQVHAVVHLAARVHVMRDFAADPLAEFRRVNVAGTLNLARQAVEAKVRRFVFVSSIKVNGEGRHINRPYTAEDVPAPTDPYGISKHEAERGLVQLAKETGLEVVIIRPVLVYGPGVKGNFLSMLQWLHRGVPLPFGALHNKRSLVALDNLVDLVMTCLGKPEAANQTFLVSDGEDLSITELLTRAARAMDRPARLFKVPTDLLMSGAAMLRKRAAMTRLLDSLQVDISKTQRLLGWAPPVNVDQELRRTVDYYLQQRTAASDVRHKEKTGSVR